MLSGCGEEQLAQSAPTPPEIPTIKTSTKTIPVLTRLPARTSASLIAEVRPQVGGIVLAQNFKEGGRVTKQATLYQVDPASYEAALSQADAALKRAQSNQHAVEIRTVRLRQLVKSNAVSKQDLDDAEASLLQAHADVLAAQASLKVAQINLDYTKVLAPISGQIGRSSVTQGALVTPAQADPLATILQLDPMKVSISYPSTAFAQIKQQISTGKIKTSTQQFAVSLALESGELYAHKGSVTFSDPTVEPSTGTILIQAEFPNPELLLLPGMFVHATIELGEQENVITVPQKAVSRDPRGSAIVYVVDKDNKVSPKTIVTSRSQDDFWVVDSGLSVNETLVVEGFHIISRLPVGSVVTPTDANAPKSAPAATQP